jgi:hypothetical protein
MELEKLKKQMQDIAGNWNGDEPGLQEENAKIALEVIEKIDEINKLIDDLVTI